MRLHVCLSDTMSSQQRTSTSVVIVKKKDRGPKTRTVFESCFACPQRRKYLQKHSLPKHFFFFFLHFLIQFSCGMLKFSQIFTLIPGGISSELLQQVELFWKFSVQLEINEHPGPSSALRKMCTSVPALATETMIQYMM